MRRFGVVLVLLALTLTGCAATATPPVPAPSAAQQPTPAGTRSPASAVPAGPAVTKLLVFVEENHTLAEMQAGMPYAFGLARQFGYATHYTAIRHPSLPNYVAITGGQTYGITDDNSPSAHPLAGASVFGQAIAAGKTAAVYADGMPGNCATSNGGSNYAVKHNPWAYYTTERAECQKYDVPATQLDQAITSGALPNVGMVIPNLCDDAHNCSLGTADAWFKGWMTKIFAGPDWKSGHLAVVLTADEDDSSANNTVLTAVIHPSQQAHVVAAPLTHYSLTRLYEDVAGAPHLFNAATAPSMSAAFGLPLPGQSG
jgi:acid phosphatase